MNSSFITSRSGLWLNGDWLPTGCIASLNKSYTVCCFSGKQSNGKKIITEIQTRDSGDECQLLYRKYQMLKV